MCVCTSKCASHGIEEKREDIADTLCDSVTSMLRRPVESDGVALGDANGHLKVLKPRPPSFELSKAIEGNGAAQYRLIGVKGEGALCSRGILDNESVKHAQPRHTHTKLPGESWEYAGL